MKDEHKQKEAKDGPFLKQNELFYRVCFLEIGK